MPKVSIIIPVFNSEKYIGEALDSVFSQTFRDYEIIVIDDGSKDGTAEILEKHKKRIKYFYQENRGLAAARNEGIRLSVSPYLAFLDADDLFLPDKVRIQNDFLDIHPGHAMVFSDFEYFGEAHSRKPVPDCFKTGEGDLFLDLLQGNCIPVPTTLIRRECFREVGMFDESFLALEDYDLVLRVSKHKKIGFIDKILARIRLHSENMSRDATLMCQYEIQAVRKALKANPEIEENYPRLIRKRYNSIYFEAGYKLLISERSEIARKNLILAIKSYPFRLKPYVYLLASFFSQDQIKRGRKIKRSLKM